MNILVIGGGGREHSLIHKLKKNTKLENIFATPYNAGIYKDAKCIDIKWQNIDEITSFINKNKISHVIIGPEAPLEDGLADRLSNIKNLKILGVKKTSC